jgi:hypothetical protein
MEYIVYMRGVDRYNLVELVNIRYMHLYNGHIRMILIRIGVKLGGI